MKQEYTLFDGHPLHRFYEQILLRRPGELENLRNPPPRMGYRPWLTPRDIDHLVRVCCPFREQNPPIALYVVTSDQASSQFSCQISILFAILA
jgi:hypothetical protein